MTDIPMDLKQQFDKLPDGVRERFLKNQNTVMPRVQKFVAAAMTGSTVFKLETFEHVHALLARLNKLSGDLVSWQVVQDVVTKQWTLFYEVV